MYDEQKLMVFQQERQQSANNKNAKNTLRTSNLKLLPIRQHEEKIERGKVPMYQYFHPPSSFVLVFNFFFSFSPTYMYYCVFYLIFIFFIYQNVLFIHTHNKVCNFVLFKLQCFGGHACQVLERMIKHVYLQFACSISVLLKNKNSVGIVWCSIFKSYSINIYLERDSEPHLLFSF